MAKKINTCDLGTGGNKASLYDGEGNCISSIFVPYETGYPRAGWHEQRPLDWWNAVVQSTRRLLETNPDETGNIDTIAFAGHSLGAVPLGARGETLTDHSYASGSGVYNLVGWRYSGDLFEAAGMGEGESVRKPPECGGKRG